MFHNGASETAVLKTSSVGEELSAVLTVISGGIKSALQSVDMSLRTVFLLFSFSISAAVGGPGRRRC
jgi:hypothetical protein